MMSLTFCSSRRLNTSQAGKWGILSGHGQAVAALGAKTYSEYDEAALIRAAQAGDQYAFERLVQAYDQNVLRLAMNLLRSQEDASDIYQEAFLRVYRNLHNFRFDCSFHTWLYRIVTNLCLDHLRKRKVRKEESTVMETSEGPVDRMEIVPEERAEGNPQRNLLSQQLSSRSVSPVYTDSPRTDGFRTAPLPGAAIESHRRGPRYHRGSRQELPVPRDTEDACRARRFCMNCDVVIQADPVAALWRVVV